MLSPCSLCDARCCKTYMITVTPFDVLRIMENTGKKAEEFAQLSQARLLGYDPDLTLDIKNDPWCYLLSFKSHPCIFLGKNNVCSIHSFAPLSCRRYPYTAENSINARFCPFPSKLLFTLTGADRPYEPMKKEIELTKQIVKEWNKNPGTKERCMEFLLEQATSRSKERRN